MKTRTILLSILLIFTVPVITNAQVGNMLKNKAAKVLGAGVKAATNQADTATKDAAYNATDKALDKRAQNKAQNTTETEADETETETADQAPARSSGNTGGGGVNIGGLFGGKVTSKYNESYSFNNRMYMQMEMYDKKDVVKMDYFIYFSDNEPNAGIEAKIVGEGSEGEQVNIVTSSIVDGVNKTFIMLTDMGSMKMGIISEVPDETTQQAQTDANAPKPTVTKTGASKTIAGYKCDEYLYKDNVNKDYSKLWVTKDLKLTGDRRAYSKAGVPMFAGNPELENGAVLAMETYNEKNELEAKSETKEINLGYKHSISTAGFSMRQMNFAQAGGQQKK